LHVRLEPLLIEKKINIMLEMGKWPLLSGLSNNSHQDSEASLTPYILSSFKTHSISQRLWYLF
jgi:hypothetical protein